MTYASLFNDEAVALAKEDHEKYGPSATLKQNERPIVLRTHDER